MKNLRLAATVIALFCAMAAGGQVPQKVGSPTLLTHQVNSDGTVTFRYRDGSAKSVLLRTDATLDKLPMGVDANGVWSVTTPEPVKPGLYGYAFTVDGVSVSDPRNGDMRANLTAWSSEFLVPSTPPAPWELTAIPHGRVDHHLYTSTILRNLPAGQEPYVVYTPPGYDPKRKGGYPVLVLLHGYTDTEVGWTGPGRANLMFDEMVNTGKAVPMIVVMPEAYGDYQFLLDGMSVWGSADRIAANADLMGQALLREILPAVTRDYDVAPGTQNRAIAGLSMGGVESLRLGLMQPGAFAYVGGFSAVAFADVLDVPLAKADGQSSKLKLLWVACGASDALAAQNKRFVAWAKGRGFPVTAVETPGGHTWVVWRDNLLQFAPLLFR